MEKAVAVTNASFEQEAKEINARFKQARSPTRRLRTFASAPGSCFSRCGPRSKRRA